MKGKRMKKIAVLMAGAMLMAPVSEAAAITFSVPDSVFSATSETSSEQGTETAAGLGVSAAQTQTILVYMIGSDLESRNGMATSDLYEMEDAGVDSTNTRLLVYTGGSSSWEHQAVTPTNNQVLELTAAGFQTVAETSSPENMGDPNTLVSFLDYAYENYPADSYSLILWDHGGGPLCGYGMDELFNGDGMNLLELASALEYSDLVINGGKFELLGFDACLMGSVEVAHMVAPYANYLVVSEEVEPGYGWYYDYLTPSSMAQAVGGNQIGTAIIDYYQSFYDYVFSIAPQIYSDITLSCLDLSRVSQVESALNGLFSAAGKDLAAGQYNKLAQERFQTRAFGRSTEGYCYDLVDLTDLCDRMADSYPNETGTLRRAVEDMVVFSYSNVEGAGGLSLYYPFESMDNVLYGPPNYEVLDFAEDYYQYMCDFTETMTSGSSRAMLETKAMPEFTIEDDQSVSMELELTQEQQENFAKARFDVYMQEKAWMEQVAGLTGGSSDVYVPVFSSGDMELDEEGVLRVNYGGANFYIEDSSGGDPVHFFARWTGRENECDYYEADGILRSASDGETPGTLNFFVDRTTGVVTLQGFLPSPVQTGDGLAISGRGIIDVDLLSRYQSLEFPVQAKTVTYDSEGNVLPASFWEDAIPALGENSIVPGSGMKVHQTKMNQVEGVACQFSITNLYCETYCSDLLMLPESFVQTAEELLASELDPMEMISDIFGVNAK